jgi:hypothetical protein
MGTSRAEEREPVDKVVLYSTVSVDGFIADENDQPGPLFDWMSSGDVPVRQRCRRRPTSTPDSTGTTSE